MAATLPRIGWNSMPYRERFHLRASTEATDQEVEFAADWRDSLLWKPTLVSTPPATEYIYVYPLTQANKIHIINWYFRDWSGGASAAPDGWTLTGAGASVARNSTAGQFKIDQYSAQVTRAGTDCYLEYTVPNYSDYLGKRVTFGAWVRATVASRARIVVNDGVGTGASSYHTGGSAFEFLTVTREVVYNATTLTLRLQVDTGDTAAQFDGVALYQGTSVSSTPHAHAADFLAFINHNAGSGSWAFTLQTSDDPASWASPTDQVTVSPTHDRAHWRTFTSASKSAWRLKCAPAAAGSPQLYLGEVAWGPMLELENYDEGQIDVLQKRMHSELSRTRTNHPLGRSISHQSKAFEMVQRLPSRSEVTGDLKDFWDHAGGTSGLPFFFAWNQGDYSDEALYCWLPDDEQFSAPHLPGNLIERLQFRVEALAEF